MTFSLKDAALAFISANQGAKFSAILAHTNGEAHPRTVGYRDLDRCLQELRRESKVEYRKGKGAGWHPKESP